MEIVLNNKKSNTLCLNMIVKNESLIITRLLDSVLSIIDCYCICDTGSTDNTVNVIIDYFTSKNIPGKIVNEPFKNFCHNRNFALQSCLGMSDFVLLLDADMILEINNFTKKILDTGDSFFIFQGNDNFFYQNLRILRNNGRYRYNGVTHEYIDTPENNKSILLSKDVIFIRDIGDGGCKNNKFERDIQLLTEGIKNEPNNARYHFYLANSYLDLNRYDEAITAYKKRIEFGGWKEEVWYSYYKIGIAYKNMNKLADAFYYWLEGYDYYPQRLEGLYEMIKHYRIHSKHKLANMFYEKALQVLNNNEDRSGYLFLHEHVYKSSLYYEYTIFSCYNGNKNINNEVVKLLNNHTNEGEINNLIQNMKFYKDILTLTVIAKLDNTENFNVNNENIEFHSSSSCLIPYKATKEANLDGYIMNIRYVNYYIDKNGNYLNCDKHIITINKYIKLDKEFNVKDEKVIMNKFTDRRYIGIEDIRIFNDIETNELLFIGTGFHKNNKIGIMHGIYNTEEPSLNEKEVVTNFNNSSCEKNWVYCNYNNSTHVIYEWYPLKICKIDNDNVLHLIETKNMPKIFSRVRGSTCGFNYVTKIINSDTNHNTNNDTNNNNSLNITIDIEESEIWFIGHIVSYEQPRHYYHIISVFDSNMKLLRYSAPFKFEGEAIEYCLSIIVEDTRVIINYSTWDRTTRIAIYDKKYIETLLKYN
jgi:tetratricopeptide (TPR) repeat protein